MNHQDGTFTGAENANYYYQGWTPEGETKGVLFIVHGLAEHSGRYMNVVNRVVPEGYAVYAVDHYGHGKSDGVRVFVPRFETFIETLEKFYAMVRVWQPDVPIFLVGHSMGGLIASYYLLGHQNDFAGAVISGPAVKVPENITPFTVKVSGLLSKLMPKMGMLALEADGISRDPAVVDAYVNDPLVYTGKTTARLAAEMLRGMIAVNEDADTITLPIFILQGEKDTLVDPQGAQDLYDGVSSADKTLTVYEGYYHEVYNDIGKERVLDDLTAWLDAHL